MRIDIRIEEWTGGSIFALTMTMGAVVFCLSSCAPPGYVGTDTCLSCHDGRVSEDKREFLDSRHESIGCEACHGPGALHARIGGRYGLFIDGTKNVDGLCARCHQTDTDAFNQSGHAKAGVLGCLDCHDPHSKDTTRRSFTDNQLCLQCHAYSGFDNVASITAHTWHSYDPEGTGASRCVICHMTPTDRVNQKGSRSHSLIPTPPIASNLAETSPAPPNTCAGIIGCHDDATTTIPFFDVDDPQTNEWLQLLYDSRYGS